MGGRGTYASGKINIEQTYKTVGVISGVKVIQKINQNDSAALPEEAYTSNAYILLRKDKTFKQYREFNSNHTAKFDIDYHKEYKISKNYENIYHIHFYINGVRDKIGRKLTPEEFNKYKKFFKGGI